MYLIFMLFNYCINIKTALYHILFVCSASYSRVKPLKFYVDFTTAFTGYE